MCIFFPPIRDGCGLFEEPETGPPAVGHFYSFFSSPPEDSSEQRRVETLGRREPPLHLRHRDFVLGRRAQEREAAGNGAEDVGGRRGHDAVLAHNGAVVPAADT